MRDEFKKWLRAVDLLEKVLADNYNTKNTHEIDPELRDQIEAYINWITKLNPY